MEKYQVIFYEHANGDCPVEDFLSSVDAKLSAKAYRLLELVSEYGADLREPYSKHLSDGIFKLRIDVATNAIRLLYFFIDKRCVVLTNGFVKKRPKTPVGEITRAKAYRKD